MILHLRAAVEQLYAADPGSFTAQRAQLVQQARDAGDKQLATAVGALRKPTLAAWALNHFVRTRRDDVDELRRFAELLREAQRTLDSDQLRLLGRERSRRVDALAGLVTEAAAAAGHPVGAAVAAEVRDTLTAVVADADAEASVLTGALVKPLSYSGFGSVDLEDAVALDADDVRSSDARPGLEVLQGGGEGSAGAGDAVDLAERRRARRAAERTRLAAALDAEREALRSADRQVAVLTARHEEVTEGIADLERRLDVARQRLARVTGELDAATGARDAHERQEAQARRALDEHDAAD